MKDYEDEIVECPKCGKHFIKRMIYFPCNTEPARNSFYCCPYCHQDFLIRLSPREEVMTFKKEEARK